MGHRHRWIMFKDSPHGLIIFPEIANHFLVGLEVSIQGFEKYSNNITKIATTTKVSKIK